MDKTKTIICKKLKIKEGSKVKAVFSEDNSEYRFEMPEELKEVLNSDPEAEETYKVSSRENVQMYGHLVKRITLSCTKGHSLVAGPDCPMDGLWEIEKNCC